MRKVLARGAGGAVGGHLAAASLRPWWRGANCTSTTGHRLSESVARATHCFLRLLRGAGVGGWGGVGLLWAEGVAPVLRLLPNDDGAVRRTRREDLTELGVRPVDLSGKTSRKRSKILWSARTS